MADADEGTWLDLSVHPKVARQLKVWGRRLGLSAEGYAKLLLLSAMHPLVAAEMQPHADAATPFPASQQPEAYDADGSTSLGLWREQMKAFEGRMDQCPAPISTTNNTRLYDSDSFAWHDQRPAWSRYHITADGQDGVSRPSS